MNKKPSEYDKRISNNVAIVGSSEVFHFLVVREPDSISETKACCGNVRTIHNSSNISEIGIEEVLEKSKRPCKQCIRWLRKMYDVSAYPCEICERVNFLVEADFHTVEVPHAQNGHKHTQVCADCRDLLR